MTDSVLTNLIAAEVPKHVDITGPNHGRMCPCGWMGLGQDFPNHVATCVAKVAIAHAIEEFAQLVVTADKLEIRVDSWRTRAEKAEATIARIEKALAEGPLHRIDFPRSKDPYGIERQTIRAALEGEQQ